jgi:hypothetical protein
MKSTAMRSNPGLEIDTTMDLPSDKDLDEERSNEE